MLFLFACFKTLNRPYSQWRRFKRWKIAVIVVAPTGKVSFVYSHMQTSRMGQYIYLINQARGPYWEHIGPRSWQYGPSAARSVQKRPGADILPVRSRASLVNKRFITRLKKAFKVFHKLRFPSLLLISLVLSVSTAGAGDNHTSCFWKFIIQGWNSVSHSQPSILEFYGEICERFRPRPPS